VDENATVRQWAIALLGRNKGHVIWPSSTNEGRAMMVLSSIKSYVYTAQVIEGKK